VGFVRYDGLFLAGHGAWLPPAVPVADALAAGEVSARDAGRAEIEAVCVAADGDEGAPPVMAARAAEQAMARSGHTPAEVDLLLHATVYYQGHDLWSPASFIQREVLGNNCPAIEIKQMSNGGMAAIELAAGYLTAGSARVAALLTAADRFAKPGFDRWQTDPGTVYADGGTALVLSTRGGFARLLSVSTCADADLERMHRGDDPFGLKPFAVRDTVDLEVLKHAFVPTFGLAAGIGRVNAGLRTAVKHALADAGLELSEVDWFVLPHLGKRRLEAGYLRPLRADPEHTTWRFGSTIGHLGAGDQFAGIGHLAVTAQPGQTVLVIGSGGGFSWTAAVLRFEEVTR
jgi:3-oxoacyl-[acyl-carrier-protein] synthase-3